MSYKEYFDMYRVTQKKVCPYRAFMLDVVGSKKAEQYINEYPSYREFVDEIYRLLLQEEADTNTQILLKDKNNKTRLDGRKIINGNLYNPMTLGDMATYFVYNGSISTERFLELSVQAMRKFNISYSFHFNTGVYQTNDYGEGGTRLYKGYMPQILENLSKGSREIISKDSTFEMGEM